MSFLLDTGTCTAYLRGHFRVRQRFAQNHGSLFMSVITVHELEKWLVHPRTPFPLTQAFFAMLPSVPRIDVNEDIAPRAASLSTRLHLQKIRMGLADLLVAGTALERQLPLVTRSTGVFSTVPGLTVVDWTLP